MKAVSTPDGQWYLADAFGHKVSDWISEAEAKRLAAEKNGAPAVDQSIGPEAILPLSGRKPDKPSKK